MSQPQLHDRSILDASEREFSQLFRPKFEAGMAKYDSPIVLKDCLKEAKQETMDLWAYLAAETAKRERALEIVNVLMPVSYTLQNEVLWNELIQLLSTAPLAKKKGES